MRRDRGGENRGRDRGEDRGGETEGKTEAKRQRGERYRRRDILETDGKRQRTESLKGN